MAGTTELQYVDELWEAMDMGRDFVLVPPGAAEMHPASIRAVLLQARGSAGPSYFTEPRDIRCTGGEREEPATCDFVEWQHGKTSVRRVKGTGKCGWRADGKRVEWLRLKEVELTG